MVAVTDEQLQILDEEHELHITVKVSLIPMKKRFRLLEEVMLLTCRLHQHQ